MTYELSEEAQKIKSGRYLHFKGEEYQVFGVARHSETLEELIIYQNVINLSWWARPVKMFNEIVEKQGEKVPRFKLISGK